MELTFFGAPLDGWLRFFEVLLIGELVILVGLIIVGIAIRQWDEVADVGTAVGWFWSILLSAYWVFSGRFYL